MGMDKEATDIWIFGRKRPDLTPEETFTAHNNFNYDGLSAEQISQRKALIEVYKTERLEELIKKVPEFRDMASKEEKA